jgi:uncharacterized membrane protein
LDGKHWILRTKLTLTEHSSIATTCMPKIDFSDWGLMYNFDIRNKSYGCFTIHSAILSQLHLILSILIIFMLIFAVEIFHHQYFFFFFFFFFFFCFFFFFFFLKITTNNSIFDNSASTVTATSIIFETKKIEVGLG